MALTTFTQIFEHIDNTVVTVFADKIGGLVNAVSPLMMAVFTFYLLWVFFSYWQGMSGESALVDVVKRMVAWALILGLGLNLANYNSIVLPLVMGLGDDLAHFFSGSSTTNGGSIDAIATQLTDAMASNMEAARSKGIPPMNLGPIFYALANNAILFICVGLFLILAAAYILMAKVFLAILAVLGPIFIAFAMFPATRHYTNNWAGQVLNYSLYMLAVNVVAALLITYLDGVFESAISGTNLAEATILPQSIIAHAALTSLVFFIIILKLPEAISSLVGGMAVGGFGAAANVATSALRGASSVKHLKGGSGGAKAPLRSGGQIKKS